MPTKTIFDAARAGDIESLKEHLKAKPNLAALNDYRFTALHCAAMGSNSVEKSIILEALRLLVEAGSPLEMIGGGGRTALFLLAEFSPSVEPVQYLIDAGANPNVYSEHKIHVVENAMMPEVQKLLSDLTGVPIPPEPEPRPKDVKISSAVWKKIKLNIDIVFKELSDAGLIVLQDAGTTQSDGFDDCSQMFHEHSNKNSIIGFCFYSRQDLNRAKRSSDLPLSFWGAPDGNSNDTEKVGTVIVEAFKKAGFTVAWNGKSSMRPSLYLHNFSE